jgi:TolB-like protein
MLSGSVWAENVKDQVKKVAVLPFSVNSSEDINYVRDGIWDMLISRLSADSVISVTAKQKVTNMLDASGKKGLAIADVYSLGKKLDIDYVVWGSITKIGNSISLDAKLLDVATYKTPIGVFEQCRGMDDVIPRISDFAKKITYYVQGKTPPAPVVAAVQASASESSPDVPLQSPDEIKVLKAKKGTFTSVINPAFITASDPIGKKGFWISQKYKKSFKGMDIGDVNGDDLNEVVIIDEHSVMIYQKVGKNFKPLNKISGATADSYIAVDVADVNGNGTPEIIVTNIKNRRLDSFVLEFQDGKFVKIASNLKWFLRVVSVSGTPKLLGQTKGIEAPFANPIYRIVYSNGKYTEGERMSIPKGLSVYGLTIDSIEGNNAERVLSLDDYGHIYVYKETKDSAYEKIHVLGGSDKVIWKSDEVFGGSNNYVYLGDTLKTTDTIAAPEKVFIKERILTYDIDGNGKREVIVVKNLSPVGRMMKNARLFTRSEIYDLEWDGLGLAENWKTKKIQGYVIDYQFKDIDNDGKNEVVLAVGLGTLLSRSAVVAYDLEVQ